MRTVNTVLLVMLLAISFAKVWALPIDWHGTLGVDTNFLDNYRKIKGDSDLTVSDDGSQAVTSAGGGHGNASFQSYIFRISPVIIINDAATIVGEFTTGYGQGGIVGDTSSQAKADDMGHALYPVIGSGNGQVVNKLYMELYSQSAKWVLGRHSFNWALGAVFSDGEREKWSRHTYTRDGVTMMMKLGNFKIDPFYAKQGSLGSLGKGSKIAEYGVSVLYDNSERDLALGLMYAKKKSGPDSSNLHHKIEGTLFDLTHSDVKILDIYFKKVFSDLTLSVEVPIMDGEIGYLYNSNTTNAGYKAKAIIGESRYKLSESWTLGTDLGQISGADGNKSSFDAMYLHPNYQIANILFRYNVLAVADPDNYSIYDSYMTNARYLKFFAEYDSGKWNLNMAMIYAKAMETAKSGSDAYNHTKNRIFTANATQADDLGFEFDFNLNYKWNKEIQLGAALGYLKTGDYFSFSNSTTDILQAEDCLSILAKAMISF